MPMPFSGEDDYRFEADLFRMPSTQGIGEALIAMSDDEPYHLGGVTYGDDGSFSFHFGRDFTGEDHEDDDPTISDENGGYHDHLTGFYSLKQVIHNDDRDEFVWLFSKLKHDYQPQTILRYVCERRAIKCAEALISGETPLSVDLNLPSWRGMPPLHHLAYFSYRKDTPAMVELLLYHGARTDIRCVGESAGEGHSKQAVEECANKLPLQIAIEKMNLKRYYSPGWAEWTPDYSIYKLITILCLPRLQNHLEIVALLAGTTKETGEVFLEYAKEGKVIELASLLIAAPRDKLKDVIDELHQDLGTIPRDQLVAVQRLLEVFDRAGDDILAYVKSNRFYDSNDETVTDVKQFLRKSGFEVKDSEVYLGDDKWLHLSSRCHSWKASDITKRCLVDFGMAHYAKSGYRWKSCEVTNKRRLHMQDKQDPWLRHLNHEAYINELENRVKVLKVRIAEKQQGLNLHVWMDDELWNVLKKDDREEFLSIIDRKLDWFCSRQQQLLYAVCSFGSIKCAEALVKGETPLTVDLNLPCTDTGLYPLHCAALSLFPSITELFLYHGARTDVLFNFDSNQSDVFYPHEVLEEHTNKLPLHMALHAISLLPCMRDWSLKDSVNNLITLLCLPRMQNALETLSLLAMTTKETKDVFDQLSMDGEIVQVAALHIAARKKLYSVCHAYVKSIRSLDELESPVRIGQDKYERAKAQHYLYNIFEDWGQDIAAYVQEDKHNVTKYQVIEEVACMLPKPCADLSIYNWYRDEESTYPTQAPYEVRLSHDDVGMEHYGKYRFQWKSSWKRYLRWRAKRREDYKDEMESELRHLISKISEAQEEPSLFKEPADTYSRYVLCQGIPIASRSFFSHDAVNAEKSNHQFQKFSSTRAMSSMASVSDNRLKLPPANMYTRLSRRRFISPLEQQDQRAQAQSQRCRYHGHCPINSPRRVEGGFSPRPRAKTLYFMASTVGMQFLPSRRAMTSMPSAFNAYKSLMRRELLF